MLTHRRCIHATFSPTLYRSIFGLTPILVSINGLSISESSSISIVKSVLCAAGRTGINLNYLWLRITLVLRTSCVFPSFIHKLNPRHDDVSSALSSCLKAHIMDEETTTWRTSLTRYSCRIGAPAWGRLSSDGGIRTNGMNIYYSPWGLPGTSPSMRCFPTIAIRLGSRQVSRHTVRTLFFAGIKGPDCHNA